ncbi:SDR family NAD(P)-dependent oxidoreductase [Campylobacter corcagiensis]|uniref:SDR family NAD(P)-dependent oxidoreductase n=1 Tax=Campylobacter corcagiensis TaxID=1448857 RepID=A0A7M1LEN1_9BACT|nr:SDR family NAD(P)-dependent oxidoreductase [Campylobacter corcagiensis]QKF64809.1 short-chain dehydrogenase/reductase, subgroup 5 [Campylobacter corcagiensis]QOQ87029.1 SDR family NAD(P)-dependent oxidoreductase [Campylobacter corcagiensis]
MNKVVFITGATSGFGLETARIYAKNGYKVIALGRRASRLEKLKDEFESGVIHPLVVDVRDKNAVFEAVKNLEFKNIDILVNNAGLALGQDSVKDANLDDFEVMIDTNIKGFLYVTKAVLPLMNRGGTIFSIGSVAGNWPYAGSNVYGGTKAFVKQFSLNLRNDIRGSGIRVTNIEPGLCKTEFSLVRFGGDTAKAEAPYADTGYVKAQDIARIIYEISNLPANVNINRVEVMATTQSWAGFFFEK